jgi:hypothetical protein
MLDSQVTENSYQSDHQPRSNGMNNELCDFTVGYGKHEGIIEPFF